MRRHPFATLVFVLLVLIGVANLAYNQQAFSPATNIFPFGLIVILSIFILAAVALFFIVAIGGGVANKIADKLR